MILWLFSYKLTIRHPLPRQDRSGGFCTLEGLIVQGMILLGKLEFVYTRIFALLGLSEQ